MTESRCCSCAAKIADLEARLAAFENQSFTRRQANAAAQKKRRDRLRHLTSYDAPTAPSYDAKLVPPSISSVTRSLGKEPRCDFSIVQEQQPLSPSLGTTLIHVVNTTMREWHPGFYEPILLDNRTSLTVARELERDGLDTGWLCQELRKMCVMFKPLKHGKGRPPQTLAYFQRGLRAAWSRHTAGGQFELPLIAITPMIAPQRGAAAERLHVTPVLAEPAARENNQVTFERQYQPVQAVLPPAAPTHDERVYRGGYDWRAALEAPAPSRRVA